MNETLREQLLILATTPIYVIIIGMEIIRALKVDPSTELTWGGGKILDPENGKEYTVKMMPKDGGKKLLVRGYIGPFYRTQTWLRVQQ